MALAIAAVGFVLFCGSAQATFAGKNGKIAFAEFDGDGVQSDLHTINPDGSGAQPIVATADSDSDPDWSPDGTRIAFTRASCLFPCSSDIWVANADGSGATVLVDAAGNDYEPAWSPDGTKIVFGTDRIDAEGLWVMNLNNGEQTRLTAHRLDADPTWSPDGTRIAFRRHEGGDADYEIYAINADGTGEVNLTDTPLAVGDGTPDWSPDGTKIVYSRNDFSMSTYTDLYVMNANGSGQTPVVQGLTNNDPRWSPEGDKIVFRRASCTDRDGCATSAIYTVNADGSGLTDVSGVGEDQVFTPAWQGIPITAYPRPKAAPSIRAPLVPAYRPCDTGLATLVHGAPLAAPSCAASGLTSSQLTLGTPDSNGQAAGSTAQVRIARIGESPIDATNGDQADIAYEFTVTDVRRSSDLSDYAGALRVDAPLRLTDKDSTPAPAAATVVANTDLLRCAMHAYRELGYRRHLQRFDNSRRAGAGHGEGGQTLAVGPGQDPRARRWRRR